MFRDRGHGRGQDRGCGWGRGRGRGGHMWYVKCFKETTVTASLKILNFRTVLQVWPQGPPSVRRVCILYEFLHAYS